MPSLAVTQSPLILKRNLGFATVDFYDTYVICKVQGGEDLDIDKVVALHKLYREHYADKKYGYIFDRTTAFTINPMTYLECPYYPDVTAFAIVAPNPFTKKTVLFEQKFSKMKLSTFDTLDEARQWMEAYHKEIGLL